VDLSHYEHFKAHLARGDRAGAGAHIKHFVASFRSLDDKSVWVKWYLENEDIGHRVRHEIYEHLVFPVLLRGYNHSDPWCLRWLIKTVQNLYKADHLWVQVERKTDHGLLTQLQALCPDDDEARLGLLQSYVQYFRYMVHEWPAGILYGHDGASSEECDLILLDIVRARQLDTKHEHGAFFSDFQSKLFEYRSRLNRPRIASDASLGTGISEP
jgi:hypothetical protein